MKAAPEGVAMGKLPTFDGFRSPDGTRKERVELYKSRLRDIKQDVDSGNYSPDVIGQSADESSSYLLQAIEEMEGPPGRAWDRVCEVLSRAIEDVVIGSNQSATEFLEIMLSVAKTVDGREEIDSVMGVFEPIFKSRAAYINSINSKPDPGIRRWVVDAWFSRIDKGQSKAAFARQYAALVKQRFDISVTPDTIARDWLPKPKRRP